MSFRNLNLINPIIRAVTEAGYSKPTEIQKIAIPYILTGKDIIGYSQTGTGKTAAFALPIIQLLKKNAPDHKEIRTLILIPIEELAKQTEENFKIYSKYLPLSQLSLFKNISPGSQFAALRKRVDILIATPERLLDLMNHKKIDLSKIEILVMDGVDMMINMRLSSDIKSIIKMISQKKQTLFFSATESDEVRKLANTLLNEPMEITISFNNSIVRLHRKSLYTSEKTKIKDLSVNLQQDQIIGNHLSYPYQS